MYKNIQLFIFPAQFLDLNLGAKKMFIFQATSSQAKSILALQLVTFNFQQLGKKTWDLHFGVEKLQPLFTDELWPAVQQANTLLLLSSCVLLSHNHMLPTFTNCLLPYYIYFHFSFNWIWLITWFRLRVLFKDFIFLGQWHQKIWLHTFKASFEKHNRSFE